MGALLLMAALISGSAAPDVTEDDREAVERLIRAQVGTGRSADDQPVAALFDRQHILAGSGADGVGTLLVAQYTIETGLSWQIYLAVLDKDTHTTLACGRIGGKSYRLVTIRSVSEGMVDLDVMYYAPDDALCCPSVSGATTIELRDGQLWETNSRLAPRASRGAAKP